MRGFGGDCQAGLSRWRRRGWCASRQAADGAVAAIPVRRSAWPRLASGAESPERDRTAGGRIGAAARAFDQRASHRYAALHARAHSDATGDRSYDRDLGRGAQGVLDCDRVRFWAAAGGDHSAAASHPCRDHDRADCDPPAAPGRARGLGAAVEGLSRFLPDHGAAGDLRRDLGAAARSERADLAARRLRRRQASRHRALHLSPLLLDDRRLLLSAGSVRGRERAQARAGPRADRGGIRGRARGRREPRPLAYARDQRRCAQPLRYAGGPPRLHPVSQALLTIGGSIEIRAKWREEWVVSVERRFTHGGILASYGSDVADQCRLAAGYVDRILKGEKPGDLPVQAPTKYETVLNLKAAKAPGLTIPQSILATAEVIE